MLCTCFAPSSALPASLELPCEEAKPPSCSAPPPLATGGVEEAVYFCQISNLLHTSLFVGALQTIWLIVSEDSVMPIILGMLQLMAIAGAEIYGRKAGKVFNRRVYDLFNFNVFNILNVVNIFNIQR